MDVGSWLRSLGLEQYEALFRESDIDAEVLGDLTDADLEKLDVTLGHRKRLLKAIAILGAAEPAAKPTIPRSSATESAERRPITVMFCDLAGSTSIAAKLDAEDWRNLVNAYLDQASAAVTDFGGHVLKKLGDGLMALFGYPQAQENDAERAVRAALAIQRAISDLNNRNAAKSAPELSARIGIESGPVVVEATGEVFGDAPNLAARVQAEAGPGSVLITLNVQRQVAGLFVVEEQSARELKGVSRPVQLFRIVRASGGGRRGGARTLTPFVGREEELGLLTRRWERALAGEGQLVLIVGEPGLGKSRLIEEFHVGLAETPHTWSEWSASQLLQNTPLHPIAEWGRLRFGADAPAEQRLADLEGTLRLTGLDPAEHAPLLAPLVDIPLPPDRATNLPPEELRRRQLAAMTAWVLAGARSQPFVLAFEDLHWADPTSLDLLRALADRGAQAPLLLLATTRPEFRPPWSLRSHHSLISLSPLDRAGVARMVGEISARHTLSKELIEGVNERTGGVPLFVEEVTRLLVERGAQGGVQAIPPTLQQSLAARLDRLGPAREVAQIGAVLGRDFVYGLLRDVAEMEEQALQASLDRLADADLLFVEGAPPEANYRFKHALIQDAAYESLLKSRRQALHHRAAEALVEAKAQSEAIAHHFAQAGLNDLAIEWWGKAGDQALRRSAFQEAIAHLGKAIAMADKAGSADSRKFADLPAGQKMKLHADLSQATMLAKGYTAKETKEAFARLEEAARQTGETKPSFTDFYARWVVDLMQGRHAKAKQTAQAFLLAAQAGGGTTEIAAAHRALGWSCFALGELQSALSEYQRGLDLLGETSDDNSRLQFSMDARGSADGYRSCACWVAGYAESWRAAKAAAVDRAEALGHAPTSVNIYLLAASTSIIRRDAEAARSEAARVIDLSRTHGLPQYLAYGEICMGWALANLGSSATGLAMLRRALDDQKEQDGRYWRPWFLGLLAGLELTTGDPDVALRICDDALALAKETGEAWSDAVLLRLRGEILLRLDPKNHAAVETTYDQAVRTARAQGARTFELEAAHALARLYQSTNRPVEAHAVLSDALGGFAPTPEMPEIAEAQALLAALAETEEVKAEAAHRQRLTQLHVSYGNALIAARGYGARETTEAFARARESTAGDKDAPGRLSADYGLWVGSYTRGELPEMRAHSATFLNDVETRPDSPEASVAHRAAGATCWFAGEYAQARDHFERALALFRPGRDDDLAFRFGQDQGVSAMAFFALVLWPLGEADRAASLLSRMLARIASLTHGNTIALGHMLAAQFALMLGGPMRGDTNSLELARIAGAHDLPQFRAFGMFFNGWARVESDLLGGLDGMRRGVDSLRTQNILIFDGLVKIALAKTEAKAGDPGRAVAILDEALETADRLGYRAFEAELHRARGEILLKRDPANSAPAEEAFLTAIAIANKQGTRSFGLRAALSLAKLYQSTDRPADAHTILAPASEGFAPTPEMPEIAEAQALLTALAETEEVKAAAARSVQRSKLHVAYGNALIAARGYGAPETTEAFAKARGSGFAEKDAPERLAADYGLWAGSYMRGELPEMRTHAMAFLNDLEATPDSPAASVARRIAGVTCWCAGEYCEARDYFERALALFQPGRDDDMAFRFGQDPGIAAMANLAIASWPLGEVDRAMSLIDAMDTRMSGVPHIGTLSFGRMHAALFELMRGDHARGAPHAIELARLAREHELPMWGAFGVFLQGWATSASGAIGAGLEDMRQAVDSLRAQNVVLFDGLVKIALAEAEARASDPGRAVALLDEGLATADRVGHRAFEAELHRARGDILLKQNLANPAPAEESFLAAIAIAQQQGTRSFGLRAALALAKLYHSTDRPADAHAVLAPALEGFSPTPQMPQIAEAQALLVAIEGGAHGRHE